MIPMAEREKKVSVVIPTYNRVEMLCDFAMYYCVIVKNHRSDIAWAFFKGSIWGWFAPVRRRGLKLECLSMEKESTAVRTMVN